jgi:hypothetical protein
MQTYRVIGKVDSLGQLTATVPPALGPGSVEVVIIARPTESSSADDVNDTWMAGVAHEWHDDLADPLQDIYTLNDGVPVDGAR